MRMVRCLVALVLALVACGAVRSGQPRPMSPAIVEDVYREWWRQVEDCAGRRRDMRWTRFYVVETTEDKGLELRNERAQAYAVAGQTNLSGSSITIGSPWVMDGGLVRHEMGHVLYSSGYHNPDFYQRRCKHIVTCQGECLRDTVPPHRRSR